MRLSGLDPAIVEYIQNRVVQPIIEEVKETRTIRRDAGREQRRERGGSGRQMKQSLEDLNTLGAQFRNPIGFRLLEEEEGTKVEVYDMVKGDTIKRVEPEVIVSAVIQVENLLGLLLDTRI